jgi:fermentation-respiration switch protein FrsA (DUF1100 family)
MKRSLLTLILIGITFSIYSQSESQAWAGFLKPTATDSIKIIFNIQYEDNRLSGATLDLPEQFTFGLKATKFSLQNDSLQLFFANIGISYSGYFQDETFLVGTYLQSGKKIPLNLTPTQPVLPPNRPQTPKPPFPYLEEEITMNDHTGAPNIKGTLTFPEVGDCKATLILLCGSGWKDRDETYFVHKPFKVIADYFTRNGYAVFRFDDLPKKIYINATTLDFEKDAQAIIKYFRNDKRTKDQPIGLLGHSEGGLVSFIAAGNNPSIDFIISLAGPAENMSSTLLYQVKMLKCKPNEYTDSETEELLGFHKKIHQLAKEAKDVKDAKTKFEKIAAEYNRKWDDEKKQKYGFTAKDRIGWMQLLSYPWILTAMKIEPLKYIRKIKCPVYAMVGEKDLQIYHKTNLTILELNLPPKTPRKIVVFSNLNHVLQTCETGFVDEYSEIEETVAPELLEDILLWLNGVIVK